jgi:hypothetical protein
MFNWGRLRGFAPIGMLEYWNYGPPWRDFFETSYWHCNVSRTKLEQQWPYKSGLGQGIMGFKRMG